MKNLELFQEKALLADKIELTPVSLQVVGEMSDGDREITWQKLAHISGGIQRWVGDFYNATKKYGRAIEMAHDSGLEQKTVWNAGTVMASVEPSRRREGLSFGHEAEVARFEPALQEEWLEKADRHGWSVKKLRVAIRDAKLLDRPPLPDGVFDVMLADPPWEYGPENPQGGPVSLHYPSMSIEALCEMQLPRLADDAVLFMWVTNAMLKKAFMVLEGWGFEYKTNMVWIKTGLKRPGSGYYVRGRHEFVFIATRGSFTPRDRHISPIGSYFEAPVGEHSEKPTVLHNFIEQMYPNCSYVEMFARKERDGWTSWGNEAI